LSCDVIEISVQVRELELGVSNVELNEQIEALYLAGYTATQKVLDEIF